jgi:hypothetical protein
MGFMRTRPKTNRIALRIEKNLSFHGKIFIVIVVTAAVGVNLPNPDAD